MKTRREALAAGASFATLLVAPAYAATPMTTLRVEVTNDIGNPIDRASVIVRFVKGRSVTKLGKKMITNWEMRTNSEGWVKIPPIPQGDILVQVIARSYQTFGQTFEVNEEERTIQVKLNVPQRQFSSHGDMVTEPAKKDEPKKP
ncbi:carboxypeptidase regulatory-like domain-containing protein [Bryobacter aggregatus]|uniref:carboxypeptidase regulatory-like domain-containing protein n=1 Tax=Bryobacter aggregatus TaxID=360054 RepID=UPI0004E15C9D|nr:carboxypeptidase regulatory-like domain-containing protein [Bryobacter aggregatus]